VTRETDANDPLVISITSFNAGNAYTVLAAQAVLKGTIRSGSERTRVRELVQGIANAASSAAVHPGNFRTASRPTAYTASTTSGSLRTAGSPALDPDLSSASAGLNVRPK
jgi:metal-dependent amidase/aminoacylase/carboxypeptidase family protein